MSDFLSFGLYLEASGPGEETRKVRDEIGEEAMQAARSAWSDILSLKTSPEDVKLRLGKPDYEDDHMLAYLFPTRPGYRYVFEFDPRRGLLLRSEYRRIGASPSPPGPPVDASDWQVYARKLSVIGATAQEVQAWLGDPVQQYGWWPIETWEYPNGLLNLRHGVVEEETET